MSTQNFLFKNYVPAIIQQIESQKSVNKEFEVRFQQLTKDLKAQKEGGRSEYDTPIEASTFFRLKDYFNNKLGEAVETHSEDKTKSGLRQSTITTEDGHEKLLTIQKNRLWDSKDFDNKNSSRFNLFNELGLKLSLASETTVESKEFKDPDIIRNKHRFTWSDSLFQYDLTQVTSTLKGKSTESVWEFEIELISPFLEARAQGAPKLNDEEKETIYVLFYKLYLKSLELLKIINNTDMVYKRSEKNSLQRFVNDSVNAGRYQFDEFITKPRNLKIYDVVYGSLVGGKFDYTVTPKAEGLRKFLVVHDYGVWLMFPGKEYCLVEKAPNHPDQYKEWKWFPFRGTILDGEDIRPENRRFGSYKDIKHMFLPFDTLMYRGEDVRDQTLAERQKHCDILRNKVGSSTNLVIEMKPFIPLGRSSEEFFKAMKKVFDLEKRLNYDTDGVVFTPINAPYNPGNQNVKKHLRNLTNFADICKWKPADRYTIDMRVIQTPEKRGVYTSKGNLNEEFVGDERNPFDPELQIDWYDPLFYKVPNFTIVEFGPKLNSDGKRVYAENGGVILKPILVREDKPYANGSRTALDVWEDLNDPIQEKTLLGETLQLVRKYHNRVKKELLESVPGDDNHLIDIGFGRGGDITKMKKFSKVLAIEPNPENMRKSKERLSKKSKDIQSKFATLQSGGEEFEKIIESVRVTFGNEFGRKPLYISMMLSLSFFWKSKEMLQQLANTINLIKEEYYKSVPKELKNSSKHTVKFLFVTIEGHKVVKFLKENNESIQLNEALLSLSSGSSSDEENKDIVYIDFPGTIVENQTEYPVILSELRNMTDMTIVYEKEANQEKLLSENEKKYTSLYMYGEYNLPNKPIYLFRSLENLKISDDTIESLEVEKSEPEFVIPEDLVQEIPTNNTLFSALFQAYNVSSQEIKSEYALIYRKEMSESIDKVNPYDLEGRTIFESAGNGFLETISIDIDHAKAWILSDNELPPEYISWIPDVIGSNIVVNDVEYKTSLPSSNTIVLDYEPAIKVYTLKV
jgi:hypothetical protein